MCGICGVVSQSPIASGESDGVRRMNEAMLHRGPDGEGAYRSMPEGIPAHLFMMMRRLSIIDLTGGWQPLYNEDHTLAMVANGEVYNFVELRRELEARGHRFATGSDCEVVVHLYEEHGADFVNHLRGMYAIALWDAPRKRLTLVRDRMGEKPLYLHERTAANGGRQILFASELKALLATGEVPFEIDPLAINDYYHYHFVPEPRTSVVGVGKLPAGCMLVVDTDPWRVEQRRYWSLDQAPPVEGDPATVVRAELDRVAELIVRSDVPVGVALSGGVDSSVVAALASRASPGRVHAFTVGYTGTPYQDERAQARMLADHLGMPFHHVEVNPRDMAEFFPEVAFLRDDPIADISGYNYYSISRLARENNVPVLLQGHGGDELFWGYAHVRRAVTQSMRKCGELPAERFEALRALFPRKLSRTGLNDYARKIAGLAGGWQRLTPTGRHVPDQLDFYNLWIPWEAGDWAVRRLLTPRLVQGINGHRAEDRFTFPRPWGRIDILMTRLICETYLVENGFAQGDRLSMASSVELRLPLSDYKLAETVVGLRKTHTDLHLSPKAWFKQAARSILPEWVFDRPKRGFAPPGTAWLRALTDRYSGELTDGYLVQTGILRPEAAAAMAARAGNRSHRVSIWPEAFCTTLALEFWARKMSEHARRPVTPVPRASRPIAI